MFRSFGFAAAVVLICMSATTSQARLNNGYAPHAKTTSLTGFTKQRSNHRTNRQKARSKIKIEPRRKIGYVIELIVQCPSSFNEPHANGIITYSMIDKTFCQPNQDCHPTAVTAAAHVCKMNSVKSSRRD